MRLGGRKRALSPPQRRGKGQGREKRGGEGGAEQGRLVPAAQLQPGPSGGRPPPRLCPAPRPGSALLSAPSRKTRGGHRGSVRVRKGRRGRGRETRSPLAPPGPGRRRSLTRLPPPSCLSTAAIADTKCPQPAAAASSPRGARWERGGASGAHARGQGRLLPAARVRAGRGGAVIRSLRMRAHRPPSKPMTGVALHPPLAQRLVAVWPCACALLEPEPGRKKERRIRALTRFLKGQASQPRAWRASAGPAPVGAASRGGFKASRLLLSRPGICAAPASLRRWGAAR